MACSGLWPHLLRASVSISVSGVPDKENEKHFTERKNPKSIAGQQLRKDALETQSQTLFPHTLREFMSVLMHFIRLVSQ